AEGFDLPFRPLARLAQNEKRKCTGRETGGRRGLGQRKMAITQGNPAARCASDRGQPSPPRGVGCCSRLLPLPIGLLLRFSRCSPMVLRFAIVMEHCVWLFDKDDAKQLGNSDFRRGVTRPTRG